MGRIVELDAKYVPGGNYASTAWAQIRADHVEEFPRINQCKPGTFNIAVQGRNPYFPPDDQKYRTMARLRGAAVKRYGDGNHISPCARIIEMYGRRITAWLYRGGHTERPDIIELISEELLSVFLNIRHDMPLTIKIEELPEGTEGMPSPPPETPGLRVWL